MSFRVKGLGPAPFQHLYGLSDAALAAQGVKRYVAEPGSRMPDRVELRDAEAGERMLLLNYVHQPADTPYRASHAIFVLEGAQAALEVTDAIPQPLLTRPISLRAFNAEGEMVEAELADGKDLAPLIDRLFADPAVDYLQAHYARRGCYAARIERA
jgi:hypothetical protein